MTTIDLDTRLGQLVGAGIAGRIGKALEAYTARDLLWHFPRRYSSRGELTQLQGLPIGEHVTVVAQVLDVRERRMQRRNGSLLEARITDGDGFMFLTFFNQSWRVKDLMPGVRGIFSGKVTEYNGRLQLQHPDYELLSERETRERDAIDEAAAKAFAERPVPIYSATAKLSSWEIEKAVAQVLDAVLADAGRALNDPLPLEIVLSENLIELSDALERIHRPARTSDWQRARDTLRFREAFDLQLSLLDRRRRIGLTASTPRPREEQGSLAAFDATLPFTLTGGQVSAGEVIATELARSHPMHRLLQGEVGSGKTLVALRAMLQVADSGGQSALLAPTEVLASQHLRSIEQALGPKLTQQLNPVLLTSKMPTAEKRRALLDIAAGSSRIIIGTHALLSKGVTFFDLGLVVVDEQHRFGVEQRETLRQKGAEPHVLAMTATPIPRTVALTVFGDLEVSTIRELPLGRQGVETFTVPIFERPKWEERAWKRSLEEIAEGRQVYVVCPAISGGTREEGDDEFAGEEAAATASPRGSAAGSTAAGGSTPKLASVEDTLAELRQRPDYAGIRMAALTGAMKSAEKDEVMREFADGNIDVLVATTVIEVGVNVPNASVMIVRDADRFGISQLHQLRGRVGRGEHPGLCLLLTAAPPESPARERLDAVAATADGFELAEVDLQLRREGDILGTLQSGGKSTLRLLRVAEHGELIERARVLAQDLLERDPELDHAPLLRTQLEREIAKQLLDNLAKS